MTDSTSEEPVEDTNESSDKEKHSHSNLRDFLEFASKHVPHLAFMTAMIWSFSQYSNSTYTQLSNLENLIIDNSNFHIFESEDIDLIKTSLDEFEPNITPHIFSLSRVANVDSLKTIHSQLINQADMLISDETDSQRTVRLQNSSEFYEMIKENRIDDFMNSADKITKLQYLSDAIEAGIKFENYIDLYLNAQSVYSGGSVDGLNYRYNDTTLTSDQLEHNLKSSAGLVFLKIHDMQTYKSLYIELLQEYAQSSDFQQTRDVAGLTGLASFLLLLGAVYSVDMKSFRRRYRRRTTVNLRTRSYANRKLEIDKKAQHRQEIAIQRVDIKRLIEKLSAERQTSETGDINLLSNEEIIQLVIESTEQ